MVQFLVGMGQNASLPKPGRRKSLRSFRKSNTNGNLSHTFTINDNETRIELLNINQASEEELMTLPGVTREVARSIVEHRKAIGRFRKVEDLALVRGIGAERLEVLRPEICVSGRKNQSCASSRAQSYDSLRSTDSRATLRGHQRLVNVNKAGVFELQCVYGISQEVAAAIVHYREKKGPFRKVDDLLKVRGVDRLRLANFGRYLTTDSSDVEDSLNESETSRAAILTNGFHDRTRLVNGSGPKQLPLQNGLPHSSLLDIFELLSAYSPRPVLDEAFTYERKGEPAVRFACWNLHEFSFEKASNPGVREVVCRTILENGFSIIAVQEVLSVTTLKLICEELNKPKLRRIKEWRDKNHSWNFCMLDVEGSQLGFIYDIDGVAEIELISLTHGPDETKSDCEVLIASFKVDELNLQLVNLKLNKFAKIDALNQKIKDLISEEEMLVLFADFSNIKTLSSDWLNIGGLYSTLSHSTNTSYLLGSKSSETSPQHISNILFNSKVQGQITGVNGVVRKGLTHLAIPNGWTWGGTASPFCPVWTELYLNANTGTAL